jgi:hypothetical protein
MVIWKAVISQIKNRMECVGTGNTFWMMDIYQCQRKGGKLPVKRGEGRRWSISFQQFKIINQKGMKGIY